MLGVAYEALIQKLQTLDFKEGELNIKIKKIHSRTPKDRKLNLYFDAEMTSGKHVVERRFSVSLL